MMLIDEAQEILPNVLAEPRILAATDFDFRSLLTVVLAETFSSTIEPHHEQGAHQTRRPLSFTLHGIEDGHLGFGSPVVA